MRRKIQSIDSYNLNSDTFSTITTKKNNSKNSKSINNKWFTRNYHYFFIDFNHIDKTDIKNINTSELINKKRKETNIPVYNHHRNVRNNHEEFKKGYISLRYEEEKIRKKYLKKKELENKPFWYEKTDKNFVNELKKNNIKLSNMGLLLNDKDKDDDDDDRKRKKREMMIMKEIWKRWDTKSRFFDYEHFPKPVIM